MVSQTSALDSLTQLGRQRALQVDDIRRALPVDTMSTEQLAAVLLRLEENGVTIEIDPALIAVGEPSRFPRQAIRPAAPEQPSVPSHDPRLAALAAAIKTATEDGKRNVSGWSASAARPISLLILLAALIIFLVAFAIVRPA